MSLITEQIEELRQYASERKGEIADICNRAADTLELLSEKLHASQMERSSQYYNGDWIPVSERMPEEREWIGTKRFGTTISDKVFVTLENSKGERYTQYLSFQNGKLSTADQSKVDTIFKGGTPIAWMPKPKPYSPSQEEYR